MASLNEPRPAEQQFGAALLSRAKQDQPTKVGAALEFDRLKRDALGILAGMVVISVMLKLLFPLAPLGVLARLIGGVFWLFVLPGYCIMLPWQNRLELKERLVVGMLAAAGLFAIASYYLGIAGLHIRWHSWLLPSLAIIAGSLLAWRARAKSFMKQGDAPGVNEHKA